MTQRKRRRRPLQFVRRRWFHLWLLTVLMSAALAGVVRLTGNEVLEPAVFFYGAAAGPLAVLVAIHDRTGVLGAVAPAALLGTFFFGSGVGILAAGYLDAKFIGDLDSTWIPLIGFIEEPAKLLVPFAVAVAGVGRCRTKAAGVALGLASATGFAVLESMGYAFVEASREDGIFAVEGVLLARGLTAPFGHLIWTGIACAIAFGEWERHGRVVLTRAVVGGVLAAAVLHSAFDSVLSPRAAPPVRLLAPLVVIVTVEVYVRVTRELTVSSSPVSPPSPGRRGSRERRRGRGPVRAPGRRAEPSFPRT